MTLRDQIRAALAAEPMTVGELNRRLAPASYGSLRQTIYWMTEAGQIAPGPGLRRRTYRLVSA